jgi:hypothetical protein
VTKLLEMGFSTNDPKRGIAGNTTIERRFANENGETLRLRVLRVRKALFDPEQLTELGASALTDKVVLYSGYTSTIKRLVDTAPDAVEPLGPFSAVIDLVKLSQKLAEP